MSVSFAVEANTTGKYSFTCYDGEMSVEHGPFQSYEAGRDAIALHRLTCTECNYCHPALYSILDVDLSLNVSNTNASMILAHLGIQSDEYGLCGSMKAEDFLGYVLVALGMPRDDSAVASVTHRSVDENGREFGPTIYDGGLPEGYMEGKLVRLSEIATEAKRLDRLVTWG